MSLLWEIRKILTKCNADAFFQSNTDEHGTEFIADSEKRIEFLTEFTGSNASICVS